MYIYIYYLLCYSLCQSCKSNVTLYSMSGWSFYYFLFQSYNTSVLSIHLLLGIYRFLISNACAISFVFSFHFQHQHVPAMSCFRPGLRVVCYALFICTLLSIKHIFYFNTCMNIIIRYLHKLMKDALSFL